jgi:hypothetical protein
MYQGCTVLGGPHSTHGGIRVAGVTQHGPQGTLTVRDTRVEGTAGPGAAVEAKQYNRLAVHFQVGG